MLCNKTVIVFMLCTIHIVHCLYLFKELEHTLGALVSVQNLQKESMTGEKEERGRYIPYRAAHNLFNVRNVFAVDIRKRGFESFTWW